MAVIRRADVVAMVAIVVVGCIVTIAVGERIGVNRGEGWDGQSYGAWARDFPGTVLDGRLTAFQVQRVLPSAIVYAASRAAGASVIVTFQVLDALALVAAAVLLARVAVLLAWSRSSAWVAFAAAFGSFASAREALYYPTMTDPVAFALAMAIVWAYVGRRPLALALALLASAVTWPATLVLGAPLLVLPRAREPAAPAEPAPRWHQPLALAIAAAAAGLVGAWFADVLVDPHPQISGWLQRSHRELWIVTIAATVIGAGAAAYIVARDRRTFAVRAYLRGVGWRRIAIGAGLLAVVVVAAQIWTARTANHQHAFGFVELKLYYIATAVRGPLWNVVHHVVYWGPIVIVAIAAWPRIAEQSGRWGPACALVLGALVLTWITPDARHLLHFMPFVIVVVVTATQAWWTRGAAIAFGVASVAWSKVWLPIGYERSHDSYAWPDLRFFMHHAPWASDTTFLAHAAAAAVTALALWLVIRRARQS